MRTTADHQKAVQVIRAIINKWDAYGLIAGGAAGNEFEEQIDGIVTFLPRIRSREDMAMAISKIFSRTYDPEKFTPQFCTTVGNELYEALARQGVIKRVGSGGHFLDRIRDKIKSMFKS